MRNVFGSFFIGNMKHQNNINRYLELGGNPKDIKGLRHASLQNRARVVYLLKQLESKAQKPSIALVPTPKKDTNTKPKEQKNSNPQGLGIIASYPIELHKTYRKALNAWIKVCELKLQLNLLPAEEERKSLQIQFEMFKLMERFDVWKKILDHYTEHKRILPQESKQDFSKLNPIELLNMRNNLRSLITRRKKTIQKMKENLPHPDDDLYFRRLDMLNRKREELQEKKLELVEVQKLLKVF